MTKDALAQPEQKQTGIREIRVTETVKQEPVAWMCDPFGDDEYEFSAHQECENCVPCYATPPKREWVELTDEQLLACTVHNRFEYEPPYINNVGETWVARHEVALRATYENINSKLKELNK